MNSTQVLILVRPDDGEQHYPPGKHFADGSGDVTEKRQFPAEATGFGEGIDFFGDGEIPGGDAIGFE